jgi:hypothetical protein
MKQLFLVVSLFFIVACRAQEKKGNNMFEKFNLEDWRNNYKDFKLDEKGLIILEDGTKVDPLVIRTYEHGFEEIESIKEYSTPPKPAFYSIEKVFHLNKNIKEKGKNLGLNSRIKIGIWYYFDEEGNLIKEVDEDKKFGKFGYNDLLKFLDNEGVINLNTGKNRENLEIQYITKNDSTYLRYAKGLNIWYAQIYTHFQDGNPKSGFTYKINADTGEHLYKATMENIEGPVPVGQYTKQYTII